MYSPPLAPPHLSIFPDSDGATQLIWFRRRAMRRQRSHAASTPVRFVLLPCLALCARVTLAATPPPGAQNVLLILADNLRPAVGAYGDALAITPSIDSLASSSTLFATALAQFAWCAPSRNSFLSGRRPQTTGAYNFLDDFRRAGPSWVSLPGAFRAAGYYTTSVGKVFHPDLPADFDAASSWSDAPHFVDKAPCPGGTMTCALPAGALDVDADAADALAARLAARPAGAPFFAAVGFQAPRLPWVYPPAEAARYPPAAAFPLPRRAGAGGVSDAEWYRPTEINRYSDVRNLTHAAPMPPAQLRAARRAYYACVSAVDTQVGRVLAALAAANLSDSTVVAFAADHGQLLGEGDLWSMMGTLDAATRVPLLLRAPALAPQQPRVYAAGPVELVDLMPTLLALAGLPPPPPEWRLPGSDLSPAMRGGGGGGDGAAVLAKDAAFSQMTRCNNCSLAYAGEAAQCAFDADADARFAVPCALTPRADFDVMGLSIRTRDWRFTTWCAWDGERLAANLSACDARYDELFDHRGQAGRQPLFDPEAEAENQAANPALADVREALRARIAGQFGDCGRANASAC